MFFRIRAIFITSIIALFFFGGMQVNAQKNAKVIGTVRDGGTGETLFGANVFFLETSIGAATDIDGRYILTNIPQGEYILRASYLGYKQQEKKVSIASGKTVEVEFELELDLVESETVTITAQREGQLAAINQQLNSDAIKNIVSGDKIEELPEANAAEAVGRLPGVSLQREGGEGNKVVIRGLAPKYNKVQIDGVDMAGTDQDDRSSDLSMISPYLLGGIEVTKSAMADQDANQLGGTVNFVTRGAPYTKPVYKLILEGGYNKLRNTANDYRIALQSSQRLFDNLVGVSLNLDVEKRNRSSNDVTADYYYKIQDQKSVVNSFSIRDYSRDLNRYGGSLLLDYKSPGTNIYFKNMLSKIDRTEINRNESSSSLVSGSSNRSQRITFAESNTLISLSQLKLEQTIGNLLINAGLSYSYSKNETPEELGFGGTESTPLASSFPYDTRPEDIPNFMLNDLSAIALGNMSDSDLFNKEDDFGANLDLEFSENLSDNISLKVKAGLKYKRKTREYDYNTIYLNISVDPSTEVENALLSRWPYISEYISTNKFPYEPFIDWNYDPGDFMAGEYSIERIPSLDMAKEVIYYLENELGIQWEGSTQPQRFVPDFHDSKRDDYHGNETNQAAYIMPTLSIGDVFTFIPGFRYEHQETEYTAVRGNYNLQVTTSYGFVYYDTTITRTNEFFLPMIHARYKPFDWFDIRASYTQTLSRPSYNEFLPKWYIYMTGMDYSNPHLKPAKSENLDLYFSVYENKVGLFTVGLFTKSIDDLIFPRREIILSDSMAVDKYGLTEEATGQLPSRFAGKAIDGFVNNENKVKVKGIELEWQSNLWYLPGFLKNIVFSINYTYTWSEVIYPRTVPIVETVPSPFGPINTIVGNADSSYAAPLLQQPDHILNVTVGYDYEGFSIRGSMQYTSKIFRENDWRPQLRSYSDGLYIFDLAVSQKLPIEGLEVFGNLKNISSNVERDYNAGTGYMSSKEYYGMSGNLGIKYKL